MCYIYLFVSLQFLFLTVEEIPLCSRFVQRTADQQFQRLWLLQIINDSSTIYFCLRGYEFYCGHSDHMHYICRRICYSADIFNGRRRPLHEAKFQRSSQQVVYSVLGLLSATILSCEGYIVCCRLGYSCKGTKSVVGFVTFMTQQRMAITTAWNLLYFHLCRLTLLTKRGMWTWILKVVLL